MQRVNLLHRRHRLVLVDIELAQGLVEIVCPGNVVNIHIVIIPNYLLHDTPSDVFALGPSASSVMSAVSAAVSCIVIHDIQVRDKAAVEVVCRRTSVRRIRVVYGVEHDDQGLLVVTLGIDGTYTAKGTARIEVAAYGIKRNLVV